ncbi:hypothetical protein [Streptomyces sp. C]|uniref:hypothetical protein n=1 Tax=Streptomyces sp. C TaxID=253839 RepID=UPI0001B4F9EE|nr:hypothetical protein [Streptomyces sp. C]EFL19925.1 predicted protein [Streptomyces sp. C]
MAENCFPEDLIQLRAEWVRTYNRLATPPPPPDPAEFDRRLLQLSFRIRAHPYWRDHPPTRTARAALHRAAVTAPGGEPEIVKQVVDGRLVAVLPPAQGQDARG